MARESAVDQFLTQLPCLAEPYRERLAGINKTIRLEWGTHVAFIHLEEGKVDVTKEWDEYPSCIVRTKEGVLLSVIRGKTSPMEALLFGNVRAYGDVNLLLNLCSMKENEHLHNLG